MCILMLVHMQLVAYLLNQENSTKTSQLPMQAAEKNYTTTEREGLTMIYAVKKFRYYFLANKFIFFVDHQALPYLVNKPCAIG